MTLFHKSVWSDHSKGKGIPSTTSGLWYVSTSGIWSCRTKLPADIQLGLIFSLTSSQFLSGKPVLTFEHCRNQNLNNCLSRPRPCYGLTSFLHCILCAFHEMDSTGSNNASSWCVCFDFNRHFCKFSNERAPKGSFESFTSMCIASHGERKQTRNLNKYSSCINCWSILVINTLYVW